MYLQLKPVINIFTLFAECGAVASLCVRSRLPVTWCDGYRCRGYCRGCLSDRLAAGGRRGRGRGVGLLMIAPVLVSGRTVTGTRSVPSAGEPLISIQRAATSGHLAPAAGYWTVSPLSFLPLPIIVLFSLFFASSFLPRTWTYYHPIGMLHSLGLLDLRSFYISQARNSEHLL